MGLRDPWEIRLDESIGELEEEFERMPMVVRVQGRDYFDKLHEVLRQIQDRGES
ncbi:hypothetical protein [Pandoraea sp. SD6-2]|uniref:hypothetical protein n=1 Tax=Pandoraea sp. SD6-2 TaxID=1286093 RepID=UPI0003AA76C8|nr:hypothetical protein [Pandoraea sp. SD6-2]